MAIVLIEHFHRRVATVHFYDDSGPRFLFHYPHRPETGIDLYLIVHTYVYYIHLYVDVINTRTYVATMMFIVQ